MAKSNSPLDANIQQGFSLGYRHREDITTLRPNVLVTGSHDVLTNTFQRVGNRKGYTLDGQRSTAVNTTGIYGVFDWDKHNGTEQHLRVGFNTTGTDGILQFRYVAAAGDKWSGNTFTDGQVYWIDLLGSRPSQEHDFCTFWDEVNEIKDFCLFVDGTPHIYMWSGGVGTISSTSWATGSISVLNETPTAGGAGYGVGDTFSITTGGTGATGIVTEVTAGVVTKVDLTAPGTGYTTGAGKATTNLTGTGVGLTVNITTVAQGFIKFSGSKSGDQLGFLSAGIYTQNVLINGNTYTYSQIIGLYLVGISADPTGEATNSVVVQAVQTIANSEMTGIPDTFKNSLIENLGNQIYVTASDQNTLYLSKVSNFRDYTFSAIRKQGEGALIILDGVPTAMQQQGQGMFISAGKKFWYETEFKLSADNIYENVDAVPRKTTSLQAAQSQYLTTKIKNLIAFVSFEQQINTFGISANFFTDPQVSDISYSISNDVISANFSKGQVMYFNKYIFITAPGDGVMFIYNMTLDMTDGLVDTAKHYWEAPQHFPFAKMSIIGGALYGHGYETSNTFKLFDGYNDDSHSYKAIALFAYNTNGDRTATKASNQLFLEGYKRQSTKLTGYLRRNLNGPVAKWSWEVLPERCLTVPIDDASIGKSPIGESPIGGTINQTDPDSTPPKFRLVQTFPKSPYFEEQVGFSSDGVDQRWEILSFGTNATLTTENQASIFDPDLAP